MMEVFLSWSEAKEVVEKKGMEFFVNLLEKRYGLKFFGCSTDWIENPRYICKLKGARGDLIIEWAVVGEFSLLEGIA